MSSPWRRPPLLPRAAVRLGFLGLAPLLVSALVSLSRHPDTAHLGVLSFSIYAAALLSFLGGARCGIEIMRDPAHPNPVRLLFSALPSLAGWALALFVAVVPGALGAASIFAGLFAGQYVWDHRSADAGAPPWYPLLRQVLTGGAMIACMLIPLATALRRF
ncbi:DUF3429 domain-containing protein [Terricaulis sp.]|uniref:DUF3429 domain-containing protein n=1 Tax=Terricaulis sp. TaxID=2768686 RepID=UPI003784A1A9